MNRLWTKAETRYLSENYKGMTDQEIADEIGRTATAVNRKRHALGLQLTEDELHRRFRLPRKNVPRQDGKYNFNWKGGVSKNNMRYKRRFQKKYPEKARAHQKVSDAKRSGKLVKKPCEKCGDKNVHAHHDDYSKPLDVRWLCPPCHRAHHQTLNPNQNDQI